MSLDAKIRFVDNIKVKLADKFTLTDMDSLVATLNDELTNYKVELEENCYGSTEDFLDAYIGALSVEGKSKKTIKRYDYIIRRFLNDVKIPSEKMSVFNIRSYFAKEKNRGISDRTLDGVRQILNIYFGWLHREGVIKTNPMGNIGAIKSKKKILDVFSDVDIERMKPHCKTTRDLAIIMFLLTTGCRIEEVCNLNKSDVNLKSFEVKVLGKGNKERIVYLDDVAGMFIQQYLDGRHDDNEALFVNRTMERLQQGGVRRMLKVIEKESGVNNIHPHKFRRTLATNLIKKGMPIEKVAAILGHEKIDTTMKYIVLDNSDIKYAYQKYA